MPQMPQENISSYVFPTTDLFTNQKLHPKGSVAKIVTNSSPMPFQTNSTLTRLAMFHHQHPYAKIRKR